MKALALILVCVVVAQATNFAKVRTASRKLLSIEDNPPFLDSDTDTTQPNIVPSNPGHDWDHWHDDPDTREDDDQCSNPNAAPVPPVSSVGADFKLWRTGSSYGYFSYITTGMQMPIYQHVDNEGERVVINHTTTYHYLIGNQSAIALNLRATDPLNPVWITFRQNNFGGMRNWETYYRSYLVSDGVERLSDNGRIIKSFGRGKDHHVSVNRKTSVTLEQISRGANRGFNSRHQFALAYPCSEQFFDWNFECFKRGTPPESTFAFPPFWPKDSSGHPLPFSAIPAYENFVGNANCVISQPPPIP